MGMMLKQIGAARGLGPYWPAWRPLPRPAWIVGLVGLVWNLFHAVDLALTLAHRPSLLRLMEPRMAAWVIATPVVVHVLWFVALGAGALGAALLLRASRHAGEAFFLGFCGIVAVFSWECMHGLPPNVSPVMFGITMVAFMTLSMVQCWYARALFWRGALN